MQAEGIVFATRAHVGVNIAADELRRSYNAMLLCGGSETPRNLPVPGRELKGVHFALEFLPQQTPAAVQEIKSTRRRRILATGKTCRHYRRRAIPERTALGTEPAAKKRKSVRQIRDHAQTARRPFRLHSLADVAIFNCARKVRMKKAVTREWAVATTRFEGDCTGQCEKLHAVHVGPAPKFETGFPGPISAVDAELVPHRNGLSGPVKTGMLEGLGVALDNRGNIACDERFNEFRTGRVCGRRYAPRDNRSLSGPFAGRAQKRLPAVNAYVGDPGAAFS